MFSYFVRKVFVLVENEVAMVEVVVIPWESEKVYCLLKNTIGFEICNNLFLKYFKQINLK